MTARNPTLAEAARALGSNQLQRAEQLIRASLAGDPDNPEALRLLAGVAAATGHYGDAEVLLRRAIGRAPGFVLAHADLCALLCRLNRAGEAIALLDRIATGDSGPVWALSLKAATLMSERRADEAVPVLEQLVARAPEAAIPCINLAEALQACGEVDRAVDAYRKAVALDPANGFAWYGLANLRVVRFDAADVATMAEAMDRIQPGLAKVQLGFALGRALGDQGDYEASFRHYEQANRLRGAIVPYDARATEEFVRTAETHFTAAMFGAAEAPRHGADAPIFIVGMPRSGSTLVEQILDSHPMVEGLGELFELPNIARQLAGDDASNRSLPAAVARLSAAQLREVGESYLAAIRRRRRTDRPFATDKLPANWQLVPLIRLILPQARIIDVRRDPMTCCLSSFTTYFNRHTRFPASLTDLGRYYRDYVRLMDHMDRVQPGRVHRLHYEYLVARPEDEIGRLLAHLDLPFDPACLRPHQNPRAVHTPSAQQVRQPIHRRASGRWRHYAPWLEPLNAGLRGEIMT